MNSQNRGKVFLAGAGSGDPDLITVKALKILKLADVILTDRLVSPILIDENAREDALIIYVGKQCSKGIHTPQKDINDLMVEFAFQNKTILRLKGGDASLFSNIVDELQVLVENAIPYEIIPGISAAFGAAAYCGIPLTARDNARGVRFLTLYNPEFISQKQWIDYSETDDTLVFYMSGKKIQLLVDFLLENNINPEKSIAIIQQATTPFQKTITYSFEELNYIKMPDFEYVPTLIMIGNVVNLHTKYAWIQENPHTESYFDNHKQQKNYVI